MRYVDYRDAIQAELRRSVGGLTWAELQSRLGLPYERPCPTWTKQLENDIGLRRIKSSGRSLLWQVGRQVRKLVVEPKPADLPLHAGPRCSLAQHGQHE